MILVDTSGLIAALATDQVRHAECARVLREREGPFVLSPFVLAEVDYLLAKMGGTDAALRFLAEVARGAYLLAPFGANDVLRAHEIAAKYRELGIGLADASLVVLSERYRTLQLLTLDERHFRTVRGANGRRFALLPFER